VPRRLVVRPVVVPAVLVVLALLVGLCAPPAAASDDLPVVTYRPPVDGPVVDRFDPPARRWQAGNRGVDYGVVAGTPVVAAADGEVVFAGAVADTLHVTIRHADGLRTSYSFLAEVSVHVGQRVHAGQPVGVAGGPVHVGVRTPDGTYLDPEALFAGALVPHVRLVPGAEDGLDPLAERRSLLDTLLDAGAAASAYLSDHGSEVLELAVHYAAELDPATHVRRALVAAWRWWEQNRSCTPAADPVPARTERRIAIVVSGLGTASTGNSAWQLDTATLGYEPADVVRFSYRGGRAPGEPGSTADPALDGIPVREFSKLDSQQSLDVSADRLAELMAEVARAEPGVPIDVIAHSQGGVVARLGVVTADAEGRLPNQVQNLVTLGSPHQGAPLATGVVASGQSATGDDALDVLRAFDVFDGLDNRDPAIGQLAETSDLLAAMRAAEVPDGVRFTSIGAAGDPVVPGVATDDPQADTHLILPSAVSMEAHGDLTTRPDARREVALAVRGLPPTCQSLHDAITGFVESESIRTAESDIGAGLAGTLAVVDAVRAGGDAATGVAGG
jgi:hypothetical protein